MPFPILNDALTRGGDWLRITGSTVSDWALEAGAALLASADTTIYIDTAADPDTADGSAAHPYATLAAAYAATPISGGGHAIVWHFARAGQYRGLIHPSVTRIEADDADFTVLATGTVQAGTTTSSLVTAGGLTANQYRGKLLYLPASGKYRTIRDHDTAAITPTAPWSSAPSVGETWRIVEPGVEIMAPEGAATFSTIWASTEQKTAHGIRFADPGAYTAWIQILGGSIALTACEVGATASLYLTANGARTGSSSEALRGCGLTTSATGYLTISTGSRVLLDIVTLGDTIECAASRAVIGSGHIASLHDRGDGGSLGWNCEVWVVPSSSIHPTIGDTSSTGIVVECRRHVWALTGGIVRNNSASNPTIAVDVAGALSISSTGVIGQNSGAGLSLRVQNGGKVWTDGAPAFGRGNGDADYSVDGETTANGSALNRLHAWWSAYATAYFAGSRGSSIQRRT